MNLPQPAGYDSGIALDRAGNLYVSVSAASAIYRVTSDGTVFLAASVSNPEGLAIDASHNLYVGGAAQIRKMSPSGLVTTIPSTNTNPLRAVAIDRAGAVFATDGRRVYKMINGPTFTYAGGDGSGDGVLATLPSLYIQGIAVDNRGNRFLSDDNTFQSPPTCRIREVFAGPSVVTVTPTELTFQAAAGRPATASQFITIGGNAGVLFTVDAGTASWLHVTPTKGTTPQTIQLNADPTSLPGGIQTILLTLSTVGTSPSTISIPVHFSVTDPVSSSAIPVIDHGGVVSAADPQRLAPVARGGLIAIYGSGLADTTMRAPSVPLPSTLGGVQVLLGGRPLPLLYVSPGQIDAIVPYDTPAGTPLAIQVFSKATPSLPETVVVAEAQPAIFILPQFGPAQAAIVSGGGLAVPQSPVTAGDHITIYCEGLGAVGPDFTAGDLAPSDQLYWTTSPVFVSIGGQPATVEFSGLAPGSVGSIRSMSSFPGV